MTRRLAGTLLSCVAASGCNADSIEGPTITIERYDEVAKCYRPCDGVVETEVAEELGKATVCADGGAPDTTCTLQQGGPKARVVVDYGALDLDACTDVTLPKLELLVEDAAPIAGKLTGTCTETGRYLAHAVVSIPVTLGKRVAFRASSGSGYVTTTPWFESTRPKPEVSISLCKDEEPCSLVAGVEKTDVLVKLPRGVATTPASVAWSTDKTVTQELPLPEFKIEEDRQVSRVQITAPDAPGAKLTVTARVGDLDSVSVTGIDLAAPRDLIVAMRRADSALPFDFETLTPPKVAANDPDPACRKLDVAARAPDGSPAGQIAMEASQGSFENGTAKITKSLSAVQTDVLAKLSLGADATTPKVVVFATSGDRLAGAFSFDQVPIWPVSIALAAAKPTVVVGNTGSAASSVQGTAVPPVAKAKFLPDTELFVLVKATADPSVTLPCGTPAPAGSLDCDGTPGSPAPGGCLLTPKRVSPSATGDVTIPIAAGVCFAGTVTVDVFGPSYTTMASCIADRTVDPAPIKLTSGPPLTLSFTVPPPP